MSKISDDWFFQKDVLDAINNTTFENEFTLLYQSVKNAFEYYTLYAIPIPKMKMASRMGYETWAEDFDLSKKKILLLKDRHYLSLGFRRFYSLQFSGRLHYSNSNKIYAKLEPNNELWGESKKCFVRTDALLKYLEFTKQELIFGIRSHRYSERKLEEFDLLSFGEKFKSNETNYSYYFQPLTDKTSTYHRQIKSMSILFGKYFVPIK